jgi:hypothetical protein
MKLEEISGADIDQVRPCQLVRRLSRGCNSRERHHSTAVKKGVDVFVVLKHPSLIVKDTAPSNMDDLVLMKRRQVCPEA